MSKGIIRCSVGGITLAMAGCFGLAVENTKSLTPNEIADRVISDQRRNKLADVRKAQTHRTGPVYDEIVEKCNKEEGELALAKKFNPLLTAVLEKGHGKEITFNMNACLEDGINQRVASTIWEPDIGHADENYKNEIIEGGKDVRNAFGIVGAGLLISGFGAFRASRRSVGGISPPEVK